MEQLDRIEGKLDKIESKLDNHLERIAICETKLGSHIKILGILGTTVVGMAAAIIKKLFIT